MRFIAILIVLLTEFSQFSFSQKPEASEDVHARLIQGKSHSVIAYAGKDRSFTIDVPFKSSKPSDVPGFVTIDKQIIQATLVPADKSPRTKDEKTLLTNYMNYELNYYKKKLKQNYSNLQTEWLTLQGRTFLVWYFNMPENYKLVSRQVYVSTLFGDQVIDLNAPVFKSDDWGKARNILVKLAGSMKTYDKHLDLEGLRKHM
ncbi:MAG TPA: hypothetical protein VI233_07330 [Puia sp.]